MMIISGDSAESRAAAIAKTERLLMTSMLEEFTDPRVQVVVLHRMAQFWIEKPPTWKSWIHLGSPQFWLVLGSTASFEG